MNAAAVCSVPPAGLPVRSVISRQVGCQLQKLQKGAAAAFSRWRPSWECQSRCPPAAAGHRARSADLKPATSSAADGFKASFETGGGSLESACTSQTQEA